MSALTQKAKGRPGNWSHVLWFLENDPAEQACCLAALLQSLNLECMLSRPGEVKLRQHNKAGLVPEIIQVVLKKRKRKEKKHPLPHQNAKNENQIPDIKVNVFTQKRHAAPRVVQQHRGYNAKKKDHPQDSGWGWGLAAQGALGLFFQLPANTQLLPLWLPNRMQSWSQPDTANLFVLVTQRRKMTRRFFASGI